MERKGTKRDRVRVALSTLGYRRGDLLPPTPTIKTITDLKSWDIYSAVANFRISGEIESPKDEEETFMRRSLAMLHAKGDKGIDAEPYCRIFMSPTEAHYALLFEKGRDLPISYFKKFFSTKRLEARKRQGSGKWQEGDIRELTEEEKADIRKRNTKYIPDEVIEKRAHIWVNAFRAVEAQRLPIPSGRLEWMDIVNLFTSQRTHQVQELKTALVDWMEDVDFHQIGSRRFTNPRYIAVMLYRQNADLQKSGMDLTSLVGRERLQVPGASLPQKLFTTIEDIGWMTDKVLIKTGQEENDDHLGIVPIKRVLRYVDYLKFCTYYLTYLQLHPEAISVMNPPILENHIQQILEDPRTVRAVRGWAINLRRLMDQGRKPFSLS